MVQKLIFPFVRKSFNAIRLSVEAQFAQLSFSVSGSQGLKLFFQPSQPLLRIFHFSNTRVSIFPEGEEFLVMLYAFGAKGRITDIPTRSTFLSKSIDSYALLVRKNSTSGGVAVASTGKVSGGMRKSACRDSKPAWWINLTLMLFFILDITLCLTL